MHRELFSSKDGRKPQKDASQQVQVVSYDDTEVNERLDEYIEEEVREGVSREEIKEKLLKVGWPEQMIDAELKKLVDYRRKTDSYPHVDGYISKKLSDGVPANEIKMDLLKVGWPEKIVDAELKKLGISTEVKQLDADFQLENYILKRLVKGDSLESIKSDLLRVGWHEEKFDSIVNRYLKKK